MKKLNTNQLKFLSDFLNGLSVAWFSIGVITPIFVGFENLAQTLLQIGGSLVVSFMLLLIGIKNLNEYHS
jgi:hypothetical protein